MPDTTKIVIKDQYGESCLCDKLNVSDVGKNRKPKGFVEIYEVDESGKEKLLGKENLVVYQGREWLITRAFNVANGSISATPNEFICWFGLGDGGCYGYDPLDPIPPTNLDTDLNHIVPLNSTDITFADFLNDILHPAGYYKMPMDSVSYEQDSENDSKYLLARIITTVGHNVANGYTLSEAGLYTASSTTGGYAGPFHLYAKTSFSSIVKSASRILIFVWYVFF